MEAVVVQTFNRWVKSLTNRLANNGTTNHYVQVQYDVVPVEYLPPRTRDRLMIRNGKPPIKAVNIGPPIIPQNPTTKELC